MESHYDTLPPSVASGARHSVHVTIHNKASAGSHGYAPPPPLIEYRSTVVYIPIVNSPKGNYAALALQKISALDGIRSCDPYTGTSAAAAT